MALCQLREPTDSQLTRYPSLCIRTIRSLPSKTTYSTIRPPIKTGKRTNRPTWPTRPTSRPALRLRPRRDPPDRLDLSRSEPVIRPLRYFESALRPYLYPPPHLHLPPRLKHNPHLLNDATGPFPYLPTRNEPSPSPPDHPSGLGLALPRHQLRRRVLRTGTPNQRKEHQPMPERSKHEMKKQRERHKLMRKRCRSILHRSWPNN